MKDWQWIGGYQIVKHGTSVAGKKVNALVQWDPQHALWRWSVLIDRENDGQRGATKSARLAIQMVNTFFE